MRAKSRTYTFSQALYHQLVLRSEIEGERSSRSINISWTAPLSLDVTDVDPDQWRI